MHLCIRGFVVSKNNPAAQNAEISDSLLLYPDFILNPAK
jgi:hypothetical protein